MSQSSHNKTAPLELSQLPAFDPNPSLKAALRFLAETGVTDFALIGRVATWVYLPADRQQFTKDVDIAVITTDIGKIETALKLRGLKIYQLPIGGVAVREPDMTVGFIDRRQGGFDVLFKEAIAQARRDVKIFGEIIPVVSLNYLITMKLVSGEPKDDLDAKSLLLVKDINYNALRETVQQHLGNATANRLDVFAREVGLLPPKGAYRESGPSF